MDPSSHSGGWAPGNHTRRLPDERFGVFAGSFFFWGGGRAFLVPRLKRAWNLPEDGVELVRRVPKKYDVAAAPAVAMAVFWRSSEVRCL